MFACGPEAGAPDALLDRTDPADPTAQPDETVTGEVSLALGLPGSFVAKAISVGVAHTCALVNGGIACWGANESGQLGLGNTVQQRIYRKPEPAAANVVKPIAVSAGEAHTCAVRQGGLVSCWGNNTYGQVNPRLPNGNPPTTGCPLGQWCPTPGTVSGIVDGIQIASGYDHTCVQRAGDVRCWGRSANSLLSQNTGGSPSTIPDPEPLALEAGDYFSCFRTVQRLAKCWGRRPAPDGISWIATDGGGWNIGGQSVMIAVGRKHACTLHSGGTTWCMGESTLGQAGVTTNASQPNVVEPVRVTGVSGAISVAAGARHTCALLSTGRILCWGANDHGQLGIGELTDYMPPVQVSSSVDFTAIAAGGDTTCALASGDVYCWGRNDEGQTGTNTTEARILTPRRVTW